VLTNGGGAGFDRGWFWVLGFLAKPALAAVGFGGFVPFGAYWGHANAKFIGYAGEETYLHH
jgi:hypothetical protein